MNARETYEFYTVKSRELTEKYRKLIHVAHPELGMTSAFHHAHNWGNDKAQALLKTYRRKSNALYARLHREYTRAQHKQHAKPIYIWCEYCAKIRGEK